MERELKIAELASIWGVSVPTTWNRIKKNNLTTFIKKDENNKEVNYVRISEEKLNEYIINVKNNDKNGYYEDMLNVDNDNNNVIDAEYTKQNKADRQNIIADVFNSLNDVYKAHNEEIKTVYNELTNYKSKVLLLEDKAGREGLYLQQIKDIEAENNTLKKDNNILLKWLITVIILSVLIIAALGVALAFYYNKPPQVIETEKVVTVEKPVYVKK